MAHSLISQRLLALGRRMGAALLALLVIAYITIFGLNMAERGREGLPAQPAAAAAAAAVQTVNYLADHPTTYYWNKQVVPAGGLVLGTLGRSAGLLFLALAVAAMIGIPLGAAAALTRRRIGSTLVLIVSFLGISVPSFLLAMFLWIANIAVHRALQIQVLPSAGFGWDAHMVMPALVLAVRPLAQVAQITYVSLTDVLQQDHIRTARAKGLPWPVIRTRHALRNVLIPVLNTLGSSLRFSLASLPVVEYFFQWPGVGLTLLEAIGEGVSPLVTDLVLSLGTLFLLLNLLIELLYPLLDPRLRAAAERPQRVDRRGWAAGLRDAVEEMVDWWHQARDRLSRGRKRKRAARASASGAEGRLRPAAEVVPSERRRLLLRAAYSNPAFIVGALLVVALAALAVFGGRLTQANPYEIHGVTRVEGKIGVPPFAPSSVFPWGTDHLGRDIQALVLHGARQTLLLAFSGMLARVLFGTLLGVLAGWWRGSWLDRLVTGAVGVWAAFPVTLFAMLLIQAMGIQQGMWVFVVTMAVVGWGEVAQFVRGQVIAIRPELFIEAARASGAHAGQTLVRHVIPHLAAPLLVLGAMEMGGVLMLLAELGFLNIYLGGGFRVMIGETGKMLPIVAYFSDIPEWGALLANIRNWWRSYPWMAWYPGIAFSLAIVTFNLFGQGLRRFLYEGRVNLSRLLNRYTLAAAAAAVLLLTLILRGIAPSGVYRSQALGFDAQRALADVERLTSPDLEGREGGMPGARSAAEYIAGRMQGLGLHPAGQNDTYLLAVPVTRSELAHVPRLDLLDERGEVVQELAYREDFVEYARSPVYGQGGATAMISGMDVNGRRQGAVVGLALGPHESIPGEVPGGALGTYLDVDPYDLRDYVIDDCVAVVRAEQAHRVNMRAVGAVLLVTDDAGAFLKRYLYPGILWQRSDQPVLYITPAVADRLLQTAGSSLAELDRQAAALPVGGVWVSGRGATLLVETDVADVPDQNLYSVIGYIPGTGSMQDVEGGGTARSSLDSRVIVVSAYYDGLGIGPQGTTYPGANDNASGVAVMLELARLLQQSPYQPKKTVVFVAWSGGERGESLSLDSVMGAKRGFSDLQLEAVIELSGVGAGSGSAIALGEGSSFRLVQVFQDAARRMGAATTTRGRGPHHGALSLPPAGGRQALTIHVSWDGADALAHTPGDTLATIDLKKLSQVGQTTFLGLTVLSREVDY